MGDAQSAQREGRKDEGGEEESGKVEDAQTEISTGDKPFKNNGQITEMNEKAGSSIASVNGHCEDETAADAVLTPDEDALETENPLEAEDKTQIKHVKESSNEADVAEDVPMDVIEIDAKKNDINDGFRRFFSNIGLKLSIKRGSTELLNDLPDDTNMEEPSGQEQFEDSAEEIKIEDAEQVTHVNTAQETNGNDSTTCPTLTDGTSEDVLETAEEKATEAKEDVESDNPNATLALPVVEDTQQEATPEHEPNSVSPPDQEEVVSPIKRFFTTGIFSGLRKKRKPAEDETNEKEMVDMGKKEAVEMTEETIDDQQVDKDLIDPGVEAAAVETEHKENEIQQEIPTGTSAETTDEGKPSTTDPSTTNVPESELLNSQEKEKVQASPLKRLLSGSSFKKISKKPRSRRSSDARLFDSGEHAADQLQVSVESADNQKEEVSMQPSPEATGEEDGAWASFKKLLTPKKHTRTPSLSNKEAEIPASGEEPKPSEEQQISDHSTEEGKKRKDSSVSWEAVLCGSGKKRSRKTSDSEEESPQVEDDKQEPGSKNGAELPQVNANDIKNETSVSTPKQSPLMSDAGSTWRTFKRLVTPKRKAKDEEESKDNIQSDGEVSQDESSFSLKKLLPGRKKRKPAEKQDHVSSDEAEKEALSGDEDSETPAVVPLSEFDTPESVVQIQTQVDIEPNIPKDVPEDLLQQIPEPTLPCDSVQDEAKKLEEKDDALNNKVSKAIPKDEELDDVSEIISKHQQLSDITEEGVITETMVTPVSIHEEAGRDDTIAEDLIEITSEAITAPEPISVTALADETEMVSAVSQLSSESSKTSGNTTPVPAEYEVKETEALLHQVVETISQSPKAVPISSSTPKSESIVGSVLHQIFRTFVKEDKEAKILEIHRKSEATAIKTGQTVEELDAVKELEATTKTESIPEVSDSESTECLPKVLKKLDTAEMTVDEVHEARQTHLEASIKELVKTDEQESQQQVEYQGGEKAALSIDIPHERTAVEESIAEMETEKTPSMEPEETELPCEIQAEAQKTDELETDANKTKHVQEDVVMDVEASELDSEVVGVPAQEEKPKDNPPTETLPDEAQETIQNLTEVTAEPENRTAPVKDVKNEHAQEPEKSDTVQRPGIDLEDGSVILRNVPEAEITSDLKEENIPLTAADLEAEDASKTELIKEPEVLHTIQESPLDSVVAGFPLLEEAVLEKLPEVETAAPEQESEARFEQEEELPAKATKTDEDSVKDTEKKETASTDELVVTEKTDGDSATSEPVDVSKTEDTQEEQASLLGLLMRSILPHKKVPAEDLPPKDTVTDEPQPTTEVTFEPEEPPVEVVTTENVQESEVLPSAVEETVMETKTEEGLLTEGHEVIEGVDESSATLLLADIVPVDASKTEDIQQAQELQTLEQSSLDSKIDDLETEVIVEPEEIVKLVKVDEVKESETLPPDVEDTVTETKTQGDACIEAPPEINEEGDAAVILREGSLEQTDLLTTEQVQEQEKLHTEKALPFITDDFNITADVIFQPLEQDAAVNIDDVQEPETLPSVVQDSVKEGASILEPEGGDSNIPVTEESLEPMHLSTTEQAEVQEELQTVQDSEEDSVRSLEKVLEEDIPSVDTVTEEPQKETGIEAEAVTTEKVKEPQAQESLLSVLMQSLLPHKKAGTEDLPPKESVTEETQPCTEDQNEVKEKLPVEAVTTECVQEPDLLPSHTEDAIVETKTEEYALPDLDVVIESTEGGTATSLQTESSPEEGASIHMPVKGSATTSTIDGNLETVAAQVQEPGDLQSEQPSLEDSKASGLLPLEKAVSEDIPSIETVTEEPQKETEMRFEKEEKLTVEAPETTSEVEPEVLPSDVGDVVTKTEEVVSSGMQVVTESADGESSAIPLIEGSEQHVQEPEVQESLLGLLMRSILPHSKEVSEDLPHKEVVTDEPQPKTEVRDKSEEIQFQAATTDDVQESEALPTDVVDTAKETLTEGGASLQPEVRESTKGGGAPVPPNEQSVEPIDPSMAKVREELQTIQASSLDSEEDSPLPIEKAKPEVIPTVEIVTEEPQIEIDAMAETTEYIKESQVSTSAEQEPSVITIDLPANTVKEEPQKETEMEVELQEKTQVEAVTTEEPSVSTFAEKDTVMETLVEEGAAIQMSAVKESMVEGSVTIPSTEESFELVESSKTEHVQEPEDLQTVVDSTYGGLLQLRVVSDEIPSDETPEPKQDTETVEKTAVEDAGTECVIKPEVLPSDVGDTVKDTETKEDAPSDMQVVTEGTEDGTETKPLTEARDEPVEDRQEPQVQQSLLGLLMRSILPSKTSSEDLPPEETVTDEPQQKTEVMDEPKENFPEESVTAENVPEPEGLLSDVVDAVKDSKTEVVPPGEPLVMESAEDGKETTTPTVGSAEPVDPSKTEQVQEPEVQESLLGLLMRSILPSKTSSEDLPPEETVIDEPQPKTEVIDEPKENLPAESVTADNVPKPEVQTEVDSTAGGLLQLRVVSDEIPSDETLEPKQDTGTVEKTAVEDADTECVVKPEVLPSDVGDTIKDKETKEDAPSDMQVVTEGTEGGIETKPLPESRDEPVEDTQEPQVQQSLLGLLMHSILPTKTTVTEDLPPQEETLKEEPQPKTEVKDELKEEKLSVEAVTAEYVQDVEDAVKDSKAEEVEPSGQHVVMESTDDRVETIYEPLDPSKTEHVQEPEAQQSLLGLLMRSILPDKTSSEDLPPEETVTDEPQQKTEVMDEPKENLPEESVTAENVPEPEGLLSDVEDAVKYSKTEEVAPGEHLVMESAEDGIETITPTVGSAEPVDPSKTEQVQEPEVQESLLGLLMRSILPSKTSSEDLPPEETVTDEPQPKTEVIDGPKENLPAENVQEPEGISCDVEDTVKDNKTEEVAPGAQHVVMESTDDGNEAISPTEGSAEPVDPSKTEQVQEPEVQESLLGLLMRSIMPSKTSSEDLPPEETVADEPQPKTEVIDEPKENLPGEAVTAENVQEVEPTHEAEGKVDEKQPVIASKTEYVQEQEIPSVLQDVQVEQKDSAPEVAEELQLIPPVHVTSVIEESKEPETLEKIISEEIQAPVLDNAAIKDESNFEVHLSEVQVSAEREEESKLSSTEAKTAAFEHAVVPQVSTCDQTEVSVSIPDVLLEKTLDITEPLNDDVAVTLEQDSVVQIMPPVEFDDSHKIQEQVADADVKSSEMIVDKVLEVVITETKEVMDFCHDTGDSLTPTPETEMDLVHEETKTAIQECVPDMESESAVASAEGAIKQPDVLTDVSELAEPPSNETVYPKVMEDDAEALKERHLEAPVAISDDSAIAQQVSDDLTLTRDFGLGLNVAMDSCRENLRESEAEKAKSEILVTAGDIKLSPEELDGEKVPEPTQTSQIAQGTITTTSNTELVVPQNTGIISSVGNVESPTSLSLEFKLNIQFNQGKAQPPPPQTTERPEHMKKTDVSDVGVQAEEAVEPINPTQGDEGQKKIEPTVVNAPPKEITAPETLIVFTERAVITTQPVLLDVGVHAIETVELVSEVQASQPQILKSAEPMKPADVLEVGVKAIEAVEPVTGIIPTQSAECQREIETTEASHEHTELLDSPARALITTHPQFLGVGMHLIETVEPVPEGPSSSQPATDGSESVKQTDVSELGFQESERDEPVKATIPPEGAESQSQVEATDVSDQPTEIIEPATVLDSAERAVVTTQPVLLEVALPSEEEETMKDTKTEEVATTDMHMVTENVAEADATIPPTEDTAEPVDPPKTEEVKEPEVKESLFGLLMRSILPHKKVVSEDLSEKEPHTDESQPNTEVKDEPEEPADVGAHAVETLEPAEKAPSSQLPTTDRTETVDQTDGSEVGVQVMKEIIPSEESQKQVESTEVSDQPLEVTEHVANLVEGSVILTQPELLDVGMHPVEAAEPEAKPASPQPIVERREPVKPMDDFEVEVQAMESVEEPIETAETLKQTDLAEVSDQSEEVPDLDSTEKAVLTTQVEVSDVGIPAVETEEPVASPPALMEGNEPVEQLDVSEHGVKAEEDVETMAAIIPTLRVDSPKQIEPSEVNVQQFDVGIHEVKTVLTEPASSLITTDATEPLKQADVSEVEIQAEEKVEPEKPSASTQKADSVEQSKLAETNVQATELSEPAVNLDLTERAVIMTQPVVLEIGIQPTKTEEPESNEQTTETIQPESQTAFLDEPVPSVASDQETKAAVNTEEENDQDVWMDAEEGIYTQDETEMLFLEAEEPVEKVEAQSVQEEEAGLEEEVELAPKSRTKDEESEQEVYQSGEICEIESEGEDFAIALEPQEYATASVTTLEWD